MMRIAVRRLAFVATLCAALLLAGVATAAPRIIVISLDGATPGLVEQYVADGSLPADRGLTLLRARGIRARLNQTVNPSLTAPGHIAIATGSTAAHNDVVGNTFHLVASPFATTISGFGAPIGGYSIDGPAESPVVSATPLWLALRAAGKTVVAATFPGADGIDVRVPGVPGSPVVQPAVERTVDYTVPFGAFAGIGARGFSRTAADFGPAPAATTAQLLAAGHPSFSPVLQTPAPLETFTVGGAAFDLRVAALDTTNDGTVNYDTLVVFDQTRGIAPGAFVRPATGPAYLRAADARSSPFYLEGSSNRAGTSFYVTHLSPDLATVRLVRMAANAIPRNAAVLGDVDDANAAVGFWAPQPDFRIPERIGEGFADFPDAELEAVYAELVRNFVEYQTRLVLRGIEKFPDADLVLAYIEQPDGSGHQFLLTDPRQATEPRNPASIGGGQDAAKVARYRDYLRHAYQAASEAVHRVIVAAGTEDGRPRSNVLVVSDHGFAPFHTAVNLNAYLLSQGFDARNVRAITSGPAANIYINLQGRELNGSVGRAEYVGLQQQVGAALRRLQDVNARYTDGRVTRDVFDKVYLRPLPADLNDPQFGRMTSDVIGQDSGDVFALLTVGYNFDGTQVPLVPRLGDGASVSAVLSVPNFYGAHGYDPALPEMSAIFYAAGPDVRPGTLNRVRNIDVAPTIARLLDVDSPATVDGTPIPLRIGRKVKRALASELAAIPPTGDKRVDRALEKAADHLAEAVDDKLWDDEAEPSRSGAQIFRHDERALVELAGVSDLPEAVRGIAARVAAIDQELAAAALDAAEGRASTKALARAREQMALGNAALNARDFPAAVDRYGRAWDEVTGGGARGSHDD